MGPTDATVRAAAFAAMDKLAREHPAGIPWHAIQAGFSVGGEHVHFASKPIGIFKPRQLVAALSIRTVQPKQGRPRWYQDQDPDHDPVDASTGLMRYELSRKQDNNEPLRRASEERLPLIWFVAVGEAVYDPVFPVFVEQIEGDEALLSTRDGPAVLPAIGAVEQVREASYDLRLTRHRNHQHWFSSRTRSAYGHRCAFSGLPVRELLVGAHIVPDAQRGPASVRNGICMSTLHHGAFDAHLISVDPDFKVHVAPALRQRKDGDVLAALVGLAGSELTRPQDPSDWPKPEYLEARFANFRAAHR